MKNEDLKLALILSFLEELKERLGTHERGHFGKLAIYSFCKELNPPTMEVRDGHGGRHGHLSDKLFEVSMELSKPHSNAVVPVSFCIFQNTDKAIKVNLDLNTSKQSGVDEDHPIFLSWKRFLEKTERKEIFSPLDKPEGLLLIQEWFDWVKYYS